MWCRIIVFVIIFMNRWPASIRIAVHEIPTIRCSVGVPDVLPILGPLCKSLLRAFIAEMPCERGERKFCSYVLQRVSCRTPGRCAHWNVVQLQPLIESGTLTDALHRTSVMA